MKRLNSPNYEDDLMEVEPFYPVEYKSGYNEGYYGITSSNENEKQLLLKFLSTLRKHWFLILSITLLVTGTTIVYVAQKPDYYKSEARVQVNSENNLVTGNRNNANPIIVNNSGNDPAYFTTQLQILEGAGLLRRVVKTLDLEHNQNFLNPQQGKQLSTWQNVKKMFGFYPLPTSEQFPSLSKRPEENKLNLNNETLIDTEKETERLAPMVSLLRGNLVVTPVKDSRTANKETRLIDIEYIHQDPLIAAKIANAIGDTYVLQNLEQKVQTNASASDFLQKRIAELQSAIRLGEERLINYSKTNQVISPDANQNTVVQRYSDLNNKLGQAENERIAAQTAYQAALQNQMREATAESKDPQVVALETKLNDLQQKLTQLKLDYTDEWPEVIQTKKQIESVENQLLLHRKRASDIQISTLQERLKEAIAREKELRTSFENQRSEVIRQNDAPAAVAALSRALTTLLDEFVPWLERTAESLPPPEPRLPRDGKS